MKFYRLNSKVFFNTLIISFLILIIFPLSIKADTNYLDVVINEIGWAGTKASATDEWIELYNNTNSTINLDGWILKAKDDTPTIKLNGSINPYEFYLIERTNDTTISDIKGDYVGSFSKHGNLSNKGEDLELIDINNEIIDKVYFSSGWPAGKGNPDYISMERINPKKEGSDPNNWKSNNGLKINGKDAENNPVLGTPKSKNSVYQEDINQLNSAKEEKQTENQNQNKSGNQNLENQKQINNQENNQTNNQKENNYFQNNTENQNLSYPSDKNQDLKQLSINQPQNNQEKNLKSENSESDKDNNLDKEKSNKSLNLNKNIFINEIMANPKGDDKTQEWIEIYNHNPIEINLTNWKIKNEKKIFQFPKNTKIAPESFLVLSRQTTKLTLLNKGGLLKFLDNQNNLVQKINYPKALKENYSYARKINNSWDFTSIPTPGSINIFPFKKENKLTKIIKKEENIFNKNSTNSENSANILKSFKNLKDNKEKNNNLKISFYFKIILTSLTLGAIFGTIILFIKAKLLKL